MISRSLDLRRIVFSLAFMAPLSLVYTLLQLFDPMAAREEEAQRKSLREQTQRDDDGEPPPYSGVMDAVEVGQGAPTSTAAQYACRVCGHESRSRDYCPVCLADTMRPVARAPVK